MQQYLEDIIRNPHLFKEMVFDAQILSKFDGQEFVRFYDEPWTAKRWFEIQVCAVDSDLYCCNTDLALVTNTIKCPAPYTHYLC